MDADAYDKALKGLYCNASTRVQYFDSRDDSVSDAFLIDRELSAKIQSISALTKDVAPAPDFGRKPFIAIFATGDPIYAEDSLSISRDVLRSFTEAGIFNQHFITTYALTQSHFSYHVEYDEQKVRPVAVYVYLRLPRNSRMINCSMRIRLSDLSCICLISSRVPAVLSDTKSRCMRQLPLLQTHPLHLLNFLLERRKSDFEVWIEELWAEVSYLERTTGMTPWAGFHREAINHLDTKDFTGLLQKLHAVNVELRLAQTIMIFAEGLGDDFKQLVEKVEVLRGGIGVECLRPGDRAALDEQSEYNGTILRNTKRKIMELLDRTNAQISVTYSLIAQKNSEQSITISKLTSDDSRTMKTITVLTLVFLPSTMLASLWDAGIFTLEPDRSWRVYLGTTLALTTVVFCIWYIYIWLSTRDRTGSRVDSETLRASFKLEKKKEDRLRVGSV